MAPRPAHRPGQTLADVRRRRDLAARVQSAAAAGWVVAAVSWALTGRLEALVGVATAAGALTMATLWRRLLARTVVVAAVPRLQTRQLPPRPGRTSERSAWWHRTALAVLAVTLVWLLWAGVSNGDPPDVVCTGTGRYSTAHCYPPASRP